MLFTNSFFALAIFRIKHIFSTFPSYSYTMEGNASLIPAEFGIKLRRTFIVSNNITDINVYFNDPINDIGFMSPGVNTSSWGLK